MNGHEVGGGYMLLGKIKKIRNKSGETKNETDFIIKQEAIQNSRTLSPVNDRENNSKEEDNHSISLEVAQKVIERADVDDRGNDPRVLKLLGRGAFGSVFEARINPGGDDRYVALKIIDVQRLEDVGYDAAKTNREIKFASELNELENPFIVPVFFKGPVMIDYRELPLGKMDVETCRYLYICMPLLIPLYKFEKMSGYCEERIIKIGIDICYALLACESRGIRHRDIKPDNIFVAEKNFRKNIPDNTYKKHIEESDYPVYLLGDFGNGKDILSGESLTSLIPGASGYIAPELRESDAKKHANTPQIDIFALGATLHWCANKYTLGDFGYEVSQDGSYYFPSVCASAELWEIISVATQINPEKRYASIQDFLSALLEYKKNRAIQLEKKRRILFAAKAYSAEKVEHIFVDYFRLHNALEDLKVNYKIAIEEKKDAEKRVKDAENHSVNLENKEGKQNQHLNIIKQQHADLLEEKQTTVSVNKKLSKQNRELIEKLGKLSDEYADCDKSNTKQRHKIKELENEKKELTKKLIQATSYIPPERSANTEVERHGLRIFSMFTVGSMWVLLGLYVGLLPAIIFFKLPPQLIQIYPIISGIFVFSYIVPGGIIRRIADKHAFSFKRFVIEFMKYIYEAVLIFVVAFMCFFLVPQQFMIYASIALMFLSMLYSFPQSVSSTKIFTVWAIAGGALLLAIFSKMIIFGLPDFLELTAEFFRAFQIVST